MIIHHIRVFIALVTLFPTAQAFNLGGGKPLKFALAVDMTGADTHPNYVRNARESVESVLRLTQQNDKITLYRICSYVEPIGTITINTTPKTFADLKARNNKFQSYSKAMTRSCKKGGSAITEALKQMRGNHSLMIFSDGGLSNDKQANKFPKLANNLTQKQYAAVWFAGLSGQQDGNGSIRHSLVKKLPKTPKILSSGHIDLADDFEHFKKLIQKARK